MVGTNPNSIKKVKAAKGKATKSKPVKKTAPKNSLLGVIAYLTQLNNGAPPLRDLVARRAGYGNAKNNSFMKALSRSKKRGLVDLSDKETVSLTDEGRDQAGDPPELETNQQAQETILKDLSGKMQDAFKILQHGKPHSRADLAMQLGYENETCQGFKKLLSRFRLKGYLENVDKECVQLSDMCYPNGRDE